MNKSSWFLFELLKQNLLQLNLSKKHTSFQETSLLAVNFSVRELHVCTSAIQKIKNSKSYKSTTNQFILSKKLTHECENQKINSALSRGGLWFILEL